MKLLILITISIISVNVFASEVGEDNSAAGKCPLLNSSNRSAKPQEIVETETLKTIDGTNAISK